MKVQFQAKIAQCSKVSKESPDRTTTVKLLADNLNTSDSAMLMAMVDLDENIRRELHITIDSQTDNHSSPI